MTERCHHQADIAARAVIQKNNVSNIFTYLIKRLPPILMIA